MAAANAQIGVAKAAFFPSVALNGNIGWESTEFASLLSAPSLLWMLGTTVGQVVFDGGRRAANVDFANEGYKAAEANYRQTVLNAFQQVQDGIVGLSVLDGAAKQSHSAVVDLATSTPSLVPSRSSRCSRASGRTCRSAASSGHCRLRWSRRWAAAGTRRSRPRANRWRTARRRDETQVSMAATTLL